MARSGGGLPSAVRIRRAQSDGTLGTCIVLVVISLVLLTFGAREGNSGGPISTIRGAWMSITMPVRWVGGALSVPVQRVGEAMGNFSASKERLSELKAENDSLRRRNAELEEAQQDVERLESLLGLQSLYNLQSTAARVIAGPSDSWSETLTIDKGKSSGLAVGMPVTDTRGAIGQIVSCGRLSSTVRLISDENSAVSAMIQSSRAQGILRGSQDGTLYLSLVRTDQTVEVGDTVVTSGLGGVYPKGLPLGTVASIERVSGSHYFEIEVESLTKTQTFEEVLVITSLTEEQKATAEEVALADSQDTDAATMTDAGQESADQTYDVSDTDDTTDVSASE